jgi:hypothetical protein
MNGKTSTDHIHTQSVIKFGKFKKCMHGAKDKAKRRFLELVNTLNGPMQRKSLGKCVMQIKR